ncbi:DUF2207 domain-containing protein [Candidatus Saccharibacteria bacterium]|nr:DUF2207 domain-containing protein [Candidatus Saccharibacteria bacterium]
MKKLVLFLGILGLTFVSAQPVQAVSADEKIKSFDSKVLITKDNTARVSETIVYDFGSTSHHGIYRDIPIDYYDKANTYYLTSKYLVTTDGDGQEIQAEVSEVDGNQRIRLGDPDRTITGVHTYKISYTLHPIVTKKDGKPFLNLDVIGEGWQVPIEKASATVSLELGSQMSNIAWFTTVGRTQVQQEPVNSSSFSVEGLGPYKGMTINATLPDGYVSKYLVPNQKRPMSAGDIALVALFLAVPLICGAVALVFFLRWWKAKQKRKKQTVVAQYDPPTDLTPAEIGHLEDDSSDMAEVTATIISFAVRGYLKITQNKKTGIGGIFGGNDYTLVALKPSEGLSQSEAGLFGTLFSSGSTVKLDDLDKSAMASEITSFKSATKKSLENKGFYAKDGGVLDKGNLTDLGARHWALVDGFKLFLNVVEKDRLKFTDAPEKTPERFSKLLPYAVALGVEQQWAKQFEGIDVTQSTNGWYNGNNMVAFSAASLTSDLNSGFSSAVASNSSVSSSGGSSGGGFGGGGGGSW